MWVYVNKHIVLDKTQTIHTERTLQAFNSMRWSLLLLRIRRNPKKGTKVSRTLLQLWLKDNEKYNKLHCQKWALSRAKTSDNLNKKYNIMTLTPLSIVLWWHKVFLGVYVSWFLSVWLAGM